MKKQYEKPEVEITMLDPELDIIRTSGGSGGDAGELNYDPTSDEIKF